MTQSVSSDVCTASTDMAVYEEYRNDLREWLLWSFCASLDDIREEYKGDDTNDFDLHIPADDITPERCHTLNFMLDYIASSDAPHIDAHDGGSNPSDNYEQAELKQQYIRRLNNRKQDLVAKLDEELEDYTETDPDLDGIPHWDEYIAFRDEFEQIFGEVERRMNIDFQELFDKALWDDHESVENIDKYHYRLLYLRKSADFDTLMGLPDQTFAERQAIFYDASTGWYDILEDSVDASGVTNEWNKFTALVDGHYLPLFFKKLAIIDFNELISPIVGQVSAAPDHDGEDDVFYGGISLPTYTCAPYNDDEDDEPDDYFNINSDVDSFDDAKWLAYWVRELIHGPAEDLTSEFDALNAAHDLLIKLIEDINPPFS